jgi:hypothetical protein
MITPQMLLMIFQLGMGVVTRFKSNHDAGRGLNDGDLIDGTLAALDEADRIKLKIIANAGLPIDIKTTDQLIAALGGGHAPLPDWVKGLEL